MYNINNKGKLMINPVSIGERIYFRPLEEEDIERMAKVD